MNFRVCVVQRRCISFQRAAKVRKWATGGLRPILYLTPGNGKCRRSRTNSPHSTPHICPQVELQAGKLNILSCLPNTSMCFVVRVRRIFSFLVGSVLYSIGASAQSHIKRKAHHGHNKETKKGINTRLQVLRTCTCFANFPCSGELRPVLSENQQTLILDCRAFLVLAKSWMVLSETAFLKSSILACGLLKVHFSLIQLLQKCC